MTMQSDNKSRGPADNLWAQLGCGSDRDRPRIAIRLVTRARGPLIWRPLLHGLEVGHDENLCATC